MNRKTILPRAMAVAFIATAFVACKKDKDPLIIIPPSSGSTLQLDGGTGEAAAVNSVFVDFSTDKQKTAIRDSWDLGFYSGNEFKVILNNTNGVSAVAINKTDINAVTEADVDLDTLKLGQGNGSFAVIDDPRESSILTKTVIAEVAATDDNNKVYVVNRKGGTNGSILPADQIFKIRVLRKGTGYTLQYASLNATTFRTLEIAKNADFNFQFASLLSGALVNVEPEKAGWDIVWGWSVYQFGTIPYSFSDLVFINNLAGVTAFERVYASADVAAAAYSQFNKDSVAKYSFQNRRDIIGSNWRVTSSLGGSSEPVGVRKNRFYIVKDGSGNTYKLKFLSFAPQDGGTRGKPQIEYALIN
ncbi:HmuY family protein [Niabella beijingensis]|uniref:HmuY family protein n=1 Tax=Niabella beijingensis TaxID=2872700 RepID=UPI001CBB5028|nr:HmuY family protein [Niabella beijingensis]MBZ4189619.1 HmuY family protein [Niabella beijingensis]